MIVRRREDAMLKNLLIRIDDKLHTEIKIYALRKGKNLKEYISELIRRDMEQGKKQKGI